MKKPTLTQLLSMRKLFRPKLSELKEQCPSCPFREGNDKEFGAICMSLASLHQEEYPAPLAVARRRIQEEVARFGDFICHCSAYNGDMSLKVTKENRQCPGATKWFKTHPPVGEK